jgi:hypothetical protein
MNEQLKQLTREDWRELGFHYELDHPSKEWRLMGSRGGLLRFRDLLRKYVSDPRNALKSEHEHYGPYMYLKVMTWPEAGMNADAIFGPLSALDRLASLIEARLPSVEVGASLRIGAEFAIDAEYSLVLQLQADDFDPASADPGL